MTDAGSQHETDGCCRGHASSAPNSPSTGHSVASIASLKRGDTGVVCDAPIGSGDAALLRAMGLFPEARVRLCRAGEPCIVAVSTSTDCGCGSECRIGLAKALAEKIYVRVGSPSKERV